MDWIVKLLTAAVIIPVVLVTGAVTIVLAYPLQVIAVIMVIGFFAH